MTPTMSFGYGATAVTSETVLPLNRPIDHSFLMQRCINYSPQSAMVKR
jgi:hypothetical protein